MKKILFLTSLLVVLAGMNATAQSSCDIILLSPITVTAVPGSPGMWTYSFTYMSVTAGKKSIGIKSADGFSAIINSADSNGVAISYTSEPFSWATQPVLYWIAYTAPDGGGTICAQQVLATKFIAFAAKKDGAGALLSVTIASDNFSEPLAVYRSNDGVTFKKIGEIKISNLQTTYTYKDAWPDGKKVYYKLGAEGGRYFTSIAGIAVDDAFQFNLQTKLLRVPAGTAVSIFSANGQKMISTVNVELIPLHRLPLGVYFLTMTDTQSNQEYKRSFSTFQ